MKDCWRSIGIAGSIRGSGATHLSVALANYAASGLGKKTACLELNGHGEMRRWKEAKEGGYFEDGGIQYYPDVKEEQIPILLNRAYDTILMDFGDAYEQFRMEMLRCERKVFLLNLNPWQTFAAEQMICAVKEERWGGIQPFYAGMHMQKAIREALEQKYSIKIAEVPFLPDARSIPADAFSCLDAVLGRQPAATKRKKSRKPFWKN